MAKSSLTLGSYKIAPDIELFTSSGMEFKDNLRVESFRTLEKIARKESCQLFFTGGYGFDPHIEDGKINMAEKLYFCTFINGFSVYIIKKSGQTFDENGNIVEG